MTLEQFTKEVKSNELWMEMIRVPARGKDLDAAILKVYGQVVSDETLTRKPITEHRKHIFNVLGTMPYGKQNTGVQLQQEPVKKEEAKAEPVESVPYEVHQQRIQAWLDEIAKIPAPKRVPKLTSKEIQEEGQWEPKKQRSHHHDDNQVILHYLKIEYSRLYSNPMSHEGRLLPGSPSFEDWMEEKLKQG